MQCVILAAGKGVRMMPLTKDSPKPMLRVCGKNLIEHNLDALPAEVTEIILVVSYIKEQIINYFGDSHEGRSIRYVTQDEMRGTGHALSLCKEMIHDRVLVMMADDIHTKENIEHLVNVSNCAMLVTKEKDGAGGKIITKEDGTIKEIQEGIHKGEFLLNAGVYVLPPDFLKTPLVQIPGREEYGIPQQVVVYAQSNPVSLVQLSDWIHITTADDLAHAEKKLKEMGRCFL